MPEIFPYEPNRLEIKDSVKFLTLITTYESGKEQRRTKIATPQRSFSMQFSKALINDGLTDNIWNFFKARKGMGEGFYLPSWANDAKLTTAYSSGTTLTVNNSLRFSALSGESENRLIIRKSDSVIETKTIAAIPTSTSITMNSALSNSYEVNTPVFVGYYVRFDADIMERTKLGAMIYESSLPFVELI